MVISDTDMCVRVLRTVCGTVRYLLCYSDVYFPVSPHIPVSTPCLPTIVTRTHAVHVAITALAAMDDPRARALYNTLRTTHNLVRLPGVAAFPPLEEWQGISRFCGLGHCRYDQAITGDSIVKEITSRSWFQAFAELCPRARTL